MLHQTTNDITAIVSLADMEQLTHVYFAKVDPCYGFVDERKIYSAVQQRWQHSIVDASYDAVLAGVAALGCLFSSWADLGVEATLVSLVKSRLDLAAADGPSVDIAVAAVLRTVYLRMAGKLEEVRKTLVPGLLVSLTA